VKILHSVSPSFDSEDSLRLLMLNPRIICGVQIDFANKFGVRLEASWPLIKVSLGNYIEFKRFFNIMDDFRWIFWISTVLTTWQIQTTILNKSHVPLGSQNVTSDIASRPSSRSFFNQNVGTEQSFLYTHHNSSDSIGKLHLSLNYPQVISN